MLKINLATLPISIACTNIFTDFISFYRRIYFYKNTIYLVVKDFSSYVSIKTY